MIEINNSRLFWLKRLRNYGHTGWSDPVIYAYDQQERIFLIESVIASLDIPSSIAIDYGCGSGDFSRMLLRRGFKVIGYDPFVAENIIDKNFYYSDSHHGIDTLIKDRTVGIILSITVLDHILSNEELVSVLRYMKKKLIDNGKLLMVEYALESGQSKIVSKYQAFRTLNNWKNILRKTGFVIESIYGMPHPMDSPSEGYIEYRRKFIVKVIGNLRTIPKVHRTIPVLLKPIASHIIKNKSELISLGQPEENPLKMFVCGVGDSRTVSSLM